MKKIFKLKILIPLVALLLIVNVGITMLVGIMGAVTNNGRNDCGAVETTSSTSDSTVSSADGSIDDFVKKHKEAYILSWKAGGFLPSASITQTMIENGFNFTNPNGTSFWKAHNMGGVKTSSKSNFPVTLATYGEDSVDLTGTKPGANVGDGTGGAYTWFSSYEAGIVGKAEFMAHQTLYKGAINNTNGIASLSAIADGGWATDGTYKSKLTDMYQKLGTKYQWLDRKLLLLMVRSHMKDPVHKMSVLQIVRCLLQLKKVDVVSQVAVPMERELSLQMRLHGGINQKTYQIA